VPGGDRLTLPFLVQFGCGVSSSGTLIIVAATSNGEGEEGMAETRVRIHR